MIKACRQNKESVLAKVRAGKLDSAALSISSLVDEIILSMHTSGILKFLSTNIQDKRADNTVIPYDLVWASAIAAKMKVKTSLTDIPYAISDHRNSGQTRLHSNRNRGKTRYWFDARRKFACPVR